jgi:hypothetical protein
MPKAVASIHDTVRKDLKSCPGGFIELKKMTYGQILHRQSLVTMTMIRDADTKAKGVTKSQFDMANVEVAEFEFSTCIVDHNLEDENGKQLNLKNKIDILKLDPKIGQEIDNLISELNGTGEEDEDSEGESQTGSD